MRKLIADLKWHWKWFGDKHVAVFMEGVIAIVCVTTIFLTIACAIKYLRS